ncbi:MAG: hypothetical protein AVDCRST_MAG86-4293 [uncultured Truepera sp.]|uniref:Uncharacterized protein n=1 Tax=uncultured Truepera sp. TaxID=543023 RepID=A0A6J4VUV0_9DEIN|nr:MAG: hypothetical protein AVDCRST_MAG86-4293 [uncultured Truepera sp.]
MTWALWRPRVIVLVSVLAAATQFGLPLLRPAAAFTFLLVCPGAALLGFVRLGSAVTDLVVSVALSVALTVLVAGVTVLLGSWPLEAGFWFLLVITLLCTAVQMVGRNYKTGGAS